MLYKIINASMPTTAQPTKVTTGTAIKTMLQVKPLVPMRIVEWGCSFDGQVAAIPGVVELIETDVAATVTAYVANDLTKFDAEALQFGDPTTNYISVGTAASGYTATVEGSIVTTREFDAQLIAPTNQYVYQFPLGYRAYCQAGKFTRIRMTFPVAINALCYLLVEF
jgi:hypothetical protein